MNSPDGENATRVLRTLGAILRRRRELRGRSLAEVAAGAGISTGYLSEVERGGKDVSTERLLRIARALEVSAAEVYLELARALGAPEAVEVGLDLDPRVQLRRMSEALDEDALRTVARFTAFLATTGGAARRRPIGFLR
ncbi:MAG TPA: helix-turn-helix transcriptional regulator [Candidatus Dormibacteraeota bacterium]|nr:helix-turn-helix transcriptional regulator [Candidatus Dormibacteraeota bacterium]